MFVVEKYFADFKAACQRYYDELLAQTDEALLQAFERAVTGQWYAQGNAGGP